MRRQRHQALAIALVVIAAEAAAAEDTGDSPDLRSAPDWFISEVVAVTAAQQLAVACETLSVNPAAMQERTNNVMARLDREGFDTGREDGGMLPSQEAFQAARDAFLDRHGLSEDIRPEAVCAAGEAEIDEGSPIGTLLLEVAGR